MKCKVFYASPGKLEGQIQAWLKSDECKNGIVILSCAQSQGGIDPILTIFYEDKAAQG